MTWDVEFTDEFEAWWNSLDEEQQVSADSSVRLLEALGPTLKFPHSSGINDEHLAQLRREGLIDGKEV